MFSVVFENSFNFSYNFPNLDSTNFLTSLLWYTPLDVFDFGEEAIFRRLKDFISVLSVIGGVGYTFLGE